MKDNSAFLTDLQVLKAISQKRRLHIDVSRLEKDFLAFSSLCENKKLKVRNPQLYRLRGEEIKHFVDAAKSLNLDVSTIPDGIGLAGDFKFTNEKNFIISLAPSQIMADVYSGSRLNLLPLVERVYTSGAAVIRDFAIHEALVGEVKCKRGDLLLTEVHLFPERFKTGNYTMGVNIDTPNKTIASFKELSDLLLHAKENPKTFLLDEAKVKEATRKAIELRNRIGALSRFDLPASTEFNVETNSCFLRNNGNSYYFLYSPQKDKNALVFYGDYLFRSEKEAPLDLLTINGDDFQHSLVKLLELGFYEPSLAVLEQRINDFSSLYEGLSRKSQKQISGEYPDFELLVNDLRQAKEYFNLVLNNDLRRKYIVEQPAELAEFMVCPAYKDPILLQLLNRLSWNKALRGYQNTERFIKSFSNADEEERQKLLNAATENLLFNYQQNNDVNRWLYENHKDFCSRSGIEFEITK